MPRVRFLHDFDYKPTTQVTIAYRAGMERTVRRECADKAVSAGKGQVIRNPRKEESDGGRG